jgi:ABC-type polysaccharide/polyol phosphate transport system ATPase subunit
MPTRPLISAGPAVRADSVAKSFSRPEEAVHTLKERVLHPLRKRGRRELHALRDVSFEVAKGEFFGIVGRNGSGKSTLLKCMAGIYALDRGSIWMDGRLSTFIELGVGFNPDLAARDNVVLNGIMLGLSPREARARYDRVIEFAGLRDFEDLKLKNYSSGMHVRLAFSVAIQVDADILLIDEVLAVGDAAFQQKCFDVFNDMRDAGRTIVFVSHDMGAVNRFCHRAMLLEGGEMLMLGAPEAVADRYLELNFEHDSEPEPEGSPIAAELAAIRDANRPGDGSARVTEVWLEDDAGVHQNAVRQDAPLAMRILVTFTDDVEDPVVTLTIENADHVAVLVTTTMLHHENTGRYAAGDQAVFAVSFHNILAPGRYHTVITVARPGSGLDVLDRYDREFSFMVTGSRATGGVVDIPFETSLHRLESRRRATA